MATADRKRVLVVDDNRDTVDILCKSLEEHGYEPIPAYGGTEAIQKARADVLDAVLLDVMMPGCSGLKVCHELKQEAATQHLPIVILSARNEPQDVSYAKQMGADDYLTKPVKLRKLLDSLQKHALRNRPDQAVLPGQKLLFVGSNPELTSSLQHILDTQRTGGREWFRVTTVSSCENALRMIEEDPPRGIILDARNQVKEAAKLCRQLKLTSATKHLAVIALVENAADDVKFAWANDCLMDPKPHKIAEAVRTHLRH